MLDRAVRSAVCALLLMLAGCDKPHGDIDLPSADLAAGSRVRPLRHWL